MVEGMVIGLGLYDTAGQEEYDNLRSLSYPDAGFSLIFYNLYLNLLLSLLLSPHQLTDVFILTYAVDNITSFTNIKDKWAPEVRRFCPNTPFILVGTKKDLREDPEKKGDTENFVSESEATKMATAVGAEGVYECSALTQDGLSVVFVEAVKVVLRKKNILGPPAKKKK
eukprot:TRINITY_DN4903_c0_g1_i3.p1 TRINITY_DN4903_c0_g1~~TRINITY_DN4903_c0_g1_i3.p1  ORF type:complete len:169 (-),score=28.46 TRINITY_DN4903_c0_g1_i3:118-624(-)